MILKKRIDIIGLEPVTKKQVKKYLKIHKQVKKFYAMYKKGTPWGADPVTKHWRIMRQLLGQFTPGIISPCVDSA